MTKDEVRKRCEEFLDAKPMSISITEEPECVDALEAFAREMMAEGMKEARELAQAVDSEGTAKSQTRALARKVLKALEGG